MGTHTVYSAETARPRTRIWRILGAIVAGLMVLVVVGIGWFLSIARSALPELDGPLPVAGVTCFSRRDTSRHKTAFSKWT
jgi:hypothetical protein